MERGIRKLPNGKYQVRVHIARDPVTGKIRQVTRVVDGGIRDARSKRSALEAEVAAGKHGGTASTFGYLLDAWMAHREAIGRAQSTLHEDRQRIDKVIQPALGAVPLAKLDVHAVDRFYGSQIAAGRSESTVLKYHAIIHAALRQGLRWGWVNSNAATSATKPSTVPHRITPPTPEQVRQLIVEAEGGRRGGTKRQMAGVITFGAVSGLRAGELCGLRLSDIDWVAGRVTVQRSIWQRGERSGVKDTKTHLVGTVSVGELGMEVLRRRAALIVEAAKRATIAPGLDAYVWSRDELGAEYLLPKSVSSAFVRIRDRVGVKVRLHDLRHFTATEMVARGVDIRTVSDQLRHADVRLTLAVYAGGRQDQQDQAADLLGGVLEAALAPGGQTTGLVPSS